MEKKSKVPSIALEVGIAAILITLILLTFNYFGIIPISRSVPALGFLPTQSGSAGINSAILNRMNVGGANTLRPIVRAPQPRRIENTTANITYNPIASSSATIVDNFTLDLELTAGSEDKASAASGLIFKNTFQPKEENYRSVGVFYSPQNNTWSLVAIIGEKTHFFPLKRANTQGPNYIKTYLEFSSAGRVVTAYVGGETKKTFTLPSALFNGNIPMNMIAQVAPDSVLNVYGIYYKY